MKRSCKGLFGYYYKKKKSLNRFLKKFKIILSTPAVTAVIMSDPDGSADYLQDYLTWPENLKITRFSVNASHKYF